VAALALGTAQLVADDPDGATPDGGLVRDVPAGDGPLSSPGDGPVPGGDGRSLVVGLNEAPVAPPRSGGADAAGGADADGAGTGTGAGAVVGTGAGGPGSIEPDAGSAGRGDTVPPPSPTEPPATDTTASPGTTATTAAPDPGGSGGSLQALIAILGLD
jgi:hypothetical protein